MRVLRAKVKQDLGNLPIFPEIFFVELAKRNDIKIYCYECHYERGWFKIESREELERKIKQGYYIDIFIKDFGKHFTFWGDEHFENDFKNIELYQEFRSSEYVIRLLEELFDKDDEFWKKVEIVEIPDGSKFLIGINEQGRESVYYSKSEVFVK